MYGLFTLKNKWQKVIFSIRIRPLEFSLCCFRLFSFVSDPFAGLGIFLGVLAFWNKFRKIHFTHFHVVPLCLLRIAPAIIFIFGKRKKELKWCFSVFKQKITYVLPFRYYTMILNEATHDWMFFTSCVWVLLLIWTLTKSLPPSVFKI